MKRIIALACAFALTIGILPTAAFASGGGTIYFYDGFDTYSISGGMAPSGWVSAGYDGDVSTFSGFVSDGNKCLKMYSAAAKALTVQKKFTDGLRDDRLLFGVRVMTDSNDISRNVLALKNSSAVGKTYTNIVNFAGDGYIKLNNDKVRIGKKYETNRWYDIKAFVENKDGNQYITVLIDGEVVAQRLSVVEPTMMVEGLRIVQSGANQKQGTLYVDDVSVMYPSANDAERIIDLESKFGTKNETEFADPLPSGNYTLTADGNEVETEKFADISYADFDWHEGQRIKITVGEDIKSYDISPHSYGIDAKVNKNELEFNLDRPSKLIVRINDCEKLFVFAMQPKDYSRYTSGDNVINVSERGADGTGETICTELLQKCLDDASAMDGGGVVYFPKGKYLTAYLKVHSNTTIYLEKGAVLKAQSTMRDMLSPYVADNGSNLGTAGVLFFDEAENCKLIGRGVLDGNGNYLRNTYNIMLRDIFTYRCKNILVEDVILRNPSAWNSHIVLTDNITYRDVRIINDPTVINTDGIDPDSVTDMLIENVFSYCSDDSVAIKTSDGYFLTGDDKPLVSKNITVRGGVFHTLKSSLKIGTETIGDISDVLFENNDVVSASRPVSMYVYDGAKVKNVRWINNRSEKIYAEDGMNERVIAIEFDKRKPTSASGSANGILIKNLTAEEMPKDPSRITGIDDEHRVSGVSLENISIGGRLCASLDEMNLDTNRYTDEISVTATDYPRADGRMRVRVNGVEQKFPTEPEEVGDTLLVPVRSMLEPSGAKIEWNDAEQSVTVKTGGGANMKMTAGSTAALINGEECSLSAAPFIKDGYCMVPLRAVLSLLKDSQLLYEESANTVYVTYKEDVEIEYVEPDGAFAESGGRVVIEAEHFYDKTARGDKEWILDTKMNGYSGEGTMYASPDTGANIANGYAENCPEMRYKVKFTKPGRYYFWVRSFGTSDSDSLHIGLSGREIASGTQTLGSSAGDKYEWVSITNSKSMPYIDIPVEGVYWFNIWMKEDGIRLDKFILTADKNYVPDNSGPAESQTIK